MTEKKTGPHKKTGRPSDFKDEYCDQVRKLCLLVKGIKDKEIAAFFEKSEQTINSWKRTHPEFLESIRAGKRLSDIDVAERLFDRACGARYTEQQAIKIKETKFNENGKKISEIEKVVVVDVERVQPPDTTAGVFWLTNREKEHWRNKTAQEVTGKDGGAIEHKEVPAIQKDDLQGLAGRYGKALTPDKPSNGKFH